MFNLLSITVCIIFFLSFNLFLIPSLVIFCCHRMFSKHIYHFISRARSLCVSCFFIVHASHAYRSSMLATHACRTDSFVLVLIAFPNGAESSHRSMRCRYTPFYLCTAVIVPRDQAAQVFKLFQHFVSVFYLL